MVKPERYILMSRKELEMRVLHEVFSGRPYQEICKAYHISESTIKRILERYGAKNERRCLVKVLRRRSEPPLHKVTIPKHVLEEMGIKEGDFLRWELHKNDDGEVYAIIRKVTPKLVKELVKKYTKKG